MYSVKQSISSGVSQNQIQKIKEESLSELQKSFESGKAPQIKKKYFVSLPTEEAHHKRYPTKGIMGSGSQRVQLAKTQEFVSVETVEPVHRGTMFAETLCKTLHVCW